MEPHHIIGTDYLFQGHNITLDVMLKTGEKAIFDNYVGLWFHLLEKRLIQSYAIYTYTYTHIYTFFVYM